MKKTIVDLFEESVRQYPDNTFLLEKTNKVFEPTTYKEVQTQVYRLGAGLQALGVKKGEMMALLSEGRNMWIIGELAMFYAGAVNVPLSIKLEESNDLLFRLIHGDVKYIMVSGQQLKKIRLIKDQLPDVKHIIIFDKQEEYQDREIALEDLLAKGDEFLANHTQEEFLQVAQSIQNDDNATITYTSGTTSDPKGVVLTHRNYTANVEQATTLVHIDQTWRTIIILPLDHCFAHVVGFYANKAAADPDLIFISANCGKIVSALHIVTAIGCDLGHRRCGGIISDLVSNNKGASHCPKDLASFIPKDRVGTCELLFGIFCILFIFGGVKSDKSVFGLTAAR